MKLRDFLENWGLSGLKLNIGFLEAQFAPQDADRAAAWDLYVELLTRVTTQSLHLEDGEEQSAVSSIHAVFGLTREILKRHGSGAGQFAKIAIPVLNQVIRPFTAKWHRISLNGGFQNPAQRSVFRAELESLQTVLRSYTQALAMMASVEDLTQLETN